MRQRKTSHRTSPKPPATWANRWSWPEPVRLEAERRVEVLVSLGRTKEEAVRRVLLQLLRIATGRAA